MKNPFCFLIVRPKMTLHGSFGIIKWSLHFFSKCYFMQHCVWIFYVLLISFILNSWCNHNLKFSTMRCFEILISTLYKIRSYAHNPIFVNTEVMVAIPLRLGNVWFVEEKRKEIKKIHKPIQTSLTVDCC